MRAFTFLFACCCLLAQSAIAQADRVKGVWLSEEKDGKIQIYEENGKYSGKITWGDQPNRLDDNNPDEKLRKRKLIGAVILTGFTYDGKGTWENGQIYDPNNGKTYSCLMKLKSANELEIRGYIGVSWIGRTTVWTRSE